MAPEPEYDGAAWAALAADGAVARAAAVINADAAESWSTLLPRLRERRGLSLDALARRLSERLGLTGREAKARAYLEDLEHDRLRPERLSRPLLDALAALLGAPAAWLERAGAGPAAPATALYRREGDGEVEQRLEILADAMLAGADEWDEVDEMFQGGR
jgi:transcriptional regulator with XRE-family HTH domain